MTRSEAIEVLRLYERWNLSQRGFNDAEQKILDARRELILKATRLLATDAEKA